MLLVDVVVRLVCVLRRPVETLLCDPFYGLSAQLSSCICHTVSCSLYIYFHVIINVNYMFGLYRVQLNQSHLTDYILPLDRTYYIYIHFTNYNEQYD